MNLIKRLREWETVHPDDADKPAGHLYIEASDRIEALEADKVAMQSALTLEFRKVDALEAKVERVKVLEDVLREIANGAFNDNGDVTMDHGHMIRAFFKARAALKGEE